MNDREYTQDESETIELVVWEEYIEYAIQEDWENWVNSVGYTD